MEAYDVVVIGGGILGCFTARNLRKWNLSVLLLEKEADVCQGITRANTAIVYGGYDNRVASRKAQMTVRANRNFAELCRELEVPFHRCGSLMLSFGPKGDGILEAKLKQGIQNAVPELAMLSAEEAREKESFLPEKFSRALYCPATGTVNPWQLGIAAYENALWNGIQVRFHSRVEAISRDEESYRVETGQESYTCRAIVNCGGLYADQIQELLFQPSVRLFWDTSEFLVFRDRAPKPGKIVFCQQEDGKGITLVPTVEGNLLLSGRQLPLSGELFAGNVERRNALLKEASELYKKLDASQVIRAFSAVRPNPQAVVYQDGGYRADGKSIGHFVIQNPGKGFWSLLGIKTPGLTCAQELGALMGESVAQYLGAQKNESFSPYRRAISDDDPEILCQCGKLTKAAVLQAIARGARTVEGVKRRVGTGMGPCQGSRCSLKIERLLQEIVHEGG